ncbi:MAG: GHKL domain-containing protein [Bacteroidia bacterium]|nr:GHKL domain-containing protein [Bacteroidia bacterium]
MNAPSIDDLRQVIALRGLPDEHLQWILEKAEYAEFEDGAEMTRTGDEIDSLMLVVEGRAKFYLDVNGKLVSYHTFENDESTGGTAGLLPYSRMKSSPGFAYAEGKIRVYKLHKKYFQELEQLSPELIQRLIGYMTERARYFATQQLQHEKVNALGQLAAGIAHELNNPAAAINRIASELNKRLRCNYEFTERMLLDNVTAPQIKEIVKLVDEKQKQTGNVKLSPLKRIELEDTLIDWMQQNGMEAKPSIAETFAGSGYTTDDLEIIKTIAGEKAMKNLINWLENLVVSQSVIKDLDEASSRISTLVGAIRSHVHMDRTNEKQPTDIHTDIENTLTLLGHKLRAKNIKVIKNFLPDFPQVPVHVGEMNQVWTNLIDNAIQAMSNKGELTIETCLDNHFARIKVIDNGHGIPKEIQSKIFDPFFTTKKMGEGTGIGLDLVRRIITRHNGEIKLRSEPGKTEFAICLPLASSENKTS